MTSQKGCSAPRSTMVRSLASPGRRASSCGRRVSGSGCSSRKTTSCGGRRPFSHRGTRRERLLTGHDRARRGGESPNGEVGSGSSLASPSTGGGWTPSRPSKWWRRIGRTRCWTLTAMIPSSGTGSSPTRPATLASRWLIGPCGGSRRAMVGGPRSERRGGSGQKPGPAVHDDLCDVTDE